MIKAPEDDQECYDLGYDNPKRSCREYEWRHQIFVNAYHAGQMDRQNQAPHNAEYDMADYDAATGERKQR